VVKGNPVQLVSVPEEGVPNIGVVNVGLASVGDVPKTNAPDPVSPVTAAAKLALDGVARNVATPDPRPATPVDIGKPVQLVNAPDCGVPKIGVVNVGLVIAGALFNTTLPVPVDVVTPVPPDATGSADANVRSVK
jgi:hypothetical protein